MFSFELKPTMSMRSFHYLWMSGLVCLLPSCVDNKVGDYPLPRHGGVPGGGYDMTQDIRNTETIGAGINNGNPELGATTPPGEIPILPPGGQSINVAPPDAPSNIGGNVTPPPGGDVGKKSNGKLPYAIRIPGDPSAVLSPYDNKKVSIRMADGRLIPSGKVIRAQGETDPSRKFIIP